ncbi:N-6 DNA methylase [Burkholderia cenocepacia]|uniref:site-specific DNA-methyltransferase (adenine-specific) n=1 Tax=Burkholderia cenocepacia TaxID=95486 RepID=A0A3S9N1H8_9BURK|nr:N-6 DNA methylase [Burkholderia cenocepacia]AZQ49529.1 SAM-dependent methyltransferase [Burkholderia cenocepacia]
MTTQDIVGKLWNLCNVLKDDGVTYHQYVTELTYLLFLKMADEIGHSKQLPQGHSWHDLLAQSAPERLEYYKKTLIHLGNHGSTLVQEIFSNANSFIKKPTTLSTLVDEINKLDWYSARQEGLGDIYEGLLEKNANEKKSGAGQYFTPRSLIDSMVSVMKPNLDDLIQDPAAGTGGFLIAAHHYLREHYNFNSLTKKQKLKLRKGTFFGMEHVQDTHRLALMNLTLHGIESDPNAGGIRYGDTLGPDGTVLSKIGATLILTNPPFGTKKGGGLPTRNDLTFPTSNKQFCFLQHIYLSLKEGGRAAVVLPDNVLFDSNIGTQIRRDLMDKCNLHTILRLPTGIFYAHGVKTSVLYFTRGQSDKNNTKEVWVYDLRSNMPVFGKRTELTRSRFLQFEAAFGDDPFGNAESLKMRVEQGERGRWRRFAREWIAERGDTLDIAWLRDEGARGEEGILDPVVLVEDVTAELEAALDDLRAVLLELGESSEEDVA